MRTGRERKKRETVRTARGQGRRVPDNLRRNNDDDPGVLTCDYNTGSQEQIETLGAEDRRTAKVQDERGTTTTSAAAGGCTGTATDTRNLSQRQTQHQPENKARPRVH